MIHNMGSFRSRLRAARKYLPEFGLGAIADSAACVSELPQVLADHLEATRIVRRQVCESAARETGFIASYSCALSCMQRAGIRFLQLHRADTDAPDSVSLPSFGVPREKFGAKTLRVHQFIDLLDVVQRIGIAKSFGEGLQCLA